MKQIIINVEDERSMAYACLYVAGEIEKGNVAGGMLGMSSDDWEIKTI